MNKIKTRKKQHTKFILGCAYLFFAAVVFSPSIYATAQSTLKTNEHYVFDYAKIIEEMKIKQYDDLLATIEEKHHLRIEAYIVPSLQNKPANRVEKFYINQSHKNQPQQLYRAFLFVSLKEKYVSILISDNMQDYYPSKVKEEIIAQVKSAIDQKKYQTILKNGIGGIVYYYDQHLKKTNQKTGWEVLLNNAVLLGLGVLIVIIVLRRKRYNKSP